MTSLFDPLRFGDFYLANRIVMAPLTRDRAGPHQVPTDLMATYYAQRASAGLIVSEATQISPEGQGYLDTPGIHSPEQVAGWRRITDAVHEAGGRIAAQLWHVGRVSHASLHDGALPVSSSAIASSYAFAAPSRSPAASAMRPVATMRAVSMIAFAGTPQASYGLKSAFASSAEIASTSARAAARSLLRASATARA